MHGTSRQPCKLAACRSIYYTMPHHVKCSGAAHKHEGEQALSASAHSRPLLGSWKSSFMDLPVVQHSITPASSTGLSANVCHPQHRVAKHHRHVYLMVDNSRLLLQALRDGCMLVGVRAGNRGCYQGS